MMEFSGQILKDGLINQYSNILQSHDNIGNLTKQVIGNLIGGAVINQLEVAKKHGFNIGVMDKECLFELLVGGVAYAYPPFIFDEIRDLIISDLRILGVSKEEITEELEKLKKYTKIKPIPPDPSMLKKLESYDDHPYDDHPKYKSDRILIAAYSEYLRKLNSS